MPPSPSRPIASSSRHNSSAPWGGQFKRTLTIQTLPRWSVDILETQYALNPWPSDADQEIVAKKANIDFHLAFEWFAARRAKSIGLASGFVVTLPTGCPREHLSWRLAAAEFMDPEQRAAEIQKAQCETTINSKLTGDESFRLDMPPAEGRCQSGTKCPSERSVPITVGQFLQLQYGSTFLQEPLQYELEEFSPRFTMLFEEDSVGGDIVQDSDLFAEYLNDLGDLDNPVPIFSPPTEAAEASSN